MNLKYLPLPLFEEAAHIDLTAFPTLTTLLLIHSVHYFACFGRIGERPTTINHAGRAIAVFLRALKRERERGKENTSRVISTFALASFLPHNAVTAMRQFL